MGLCVMQKRPSDRSSSLAMDWKCTEIRCRVCADSCRSNKEIQTVLADVSQRCIALEWAAGA
eukprot:2762817-Amphidinium_carterae.1